MNTNATRRIPGQLLNVRFHDFLVKRFISIISRHLSCMQVLYPAIARSFLLWKFAPLIIHSFTRHLSFFFRSAKVRTKIKSYSWRHFSRFLRFAWFQMHGYEIGHGPPPPHDMGPTPGDMAHPDSTDSYVTYLESDDSLQDNPSP